MKPKIIREDVRRCAFCRCYLDSESVLIKDSETQRELEICIECNGGVIRKCENQQDEH